MTYSKTYTASIVMLLTLLANIFGTDLPSQLTESNIDTVIQVTLGVMSFVTIIYERFQKGGVTPLGVKA